MTWLEYYAKHKTDELIDIIATHICVDAMNRNVIRECNFNNCQKCFALVENCEKELVSDGDNCLTRMKKFLKSECKPYFSNRDISFLETTSYDKLIVTRDTGTDDVLFLDVNSKAHILLVGTGIGSVFEGLFSGIAPGESVVWSRGE